MSVWKWALMAIVALALWGCAPEPTATVGQDAEPAATVDVCQPENAAKLSAAARAQAAKACFRRGNLNRPNTGKTW